MRKELKEIADTRVNIIGTAERPVPMAVPISTSMHRGEPMTTTYIPVQTPVRGAANISSDQMSKMFSNKPSINTMDNVIIVKGS